MNRLYPEQQVDVTKIDANFQEICAAGWVTEERLAVNSVPASKIVNGAATDIKIGTRLMDDMTAPTSKTGMLQDHLNNIGYMIKAITGKEDCITAPAKSIADLVAAKPIARVTMSTPQTLTTTATIVNFDTETFDVGGHFDTATYQYIPPAGYYRVTATGSFTAHEGGDGGNVQTVQIFKNGSPHHTTESFMYLPGSRGAVSISDIVPVDGDDALDLRVKKSTAGPIVKLSGCAITFEKISD